ncbi:MAG: OsmC family protein [Bryobacteraceae bacterium]|nr:OsmC family protein [Bryobacteraceae bacterium]MDW8380207.1 OsmC family protein [Bryobacterales bacterium]
MSDPVHEFSVTLRHLKDFEFLVKFDKPEGLEMTTDESPPLGRDAGPNPSRLLAAAVANCLSASLLFAFRKAGVAIDGLETVVTVKIVRNENRRLRVGKMTVVLHPQVPGEELEKARAARAVFEDFCTVTQSVARGVDVEVKVKGIDA